MQTDLLRMLVGFSIILSHLYSYFLILGWAALSSQEQTEVSLIIGPIFAVYVAAVVRKVVEI